MTSNELIDIALAARERAYAPYSHFCVGAALLCEDGRVFTGCNVENSSYSLTLCAERVALAAAVSEGYRCFKSIAIVGGREGEAADTPCYPCGACRQFMAELCDGSLTVCVKDGKNIREIRLDALLPESFTLKDFTEK